MPHKTIPTFWRGTKFQEFPNSISVIKGYVAALFGYGPRYKTLCEKGQTLEPKEGLWSSRLALYYEDLANKQPKREHQKTLKLALNATNAALLLENTPHEVIRLKEKQADLFLLVGDYEKARILTEQILADSNTSAAEKSKGTRVMEAMREDILNHSHVRLGRVALRKNDVITARQELLAARPFESSDTLLFFGCHMALAKELLEKGESGTVLQYFEQCRKLSGLSFGHQDFEKWASEIKRGKMPDFGTDMVY